MVQHWPAQSRVRGAMFIDLVDVALSCSFADRFFFSVMKAFAAPAIPCMLCASYTANAVGLNYSNSVLYGTSVSNLHKLQMAQNALARTITILPTTQSFAAFLQSVSPPSAQGKNRFRTSYFLLCCSSNLESYTCHH